MPVRYFRVPEVSEPWDADGLSGGTGPKYRDRVAAWSGTQVAEAPIWVVRYRGDETVLDEIAAKTDTTELSEDQALSVVNGADVAHLEGAGRPWDTADLRRHMSV